MTFDLGQSSSCRAWLYFCVTSGTRGIFEWSFFDVIDSSQQDLKQFHDSIINPWDVYYNHNHIQGVWLSECLEHDCVWCHNMEMILHNKVWNNSTINRWDVHYVTTTSRCLTTSLSMTSCLKRDHMWCHWHHHNVSHVIVIHKWHSRSRSRQVPPSRN